MPTLLSLAGVEIPQTVEGADLSAFAGGEPAPKDDAALITCPWPFGQYAKRLGGREYRGLRTRRYTYARDLTGPWLLYDNLTDPHQLENLVGRPDMADVQADLEAALQAKLDATGDEFLPGEEYVRQWGYAVDESGTVPYTN
ncbi:MAG: sulfatase/phosphatase domain-containing protein [Planctomycetota bacterium]|jgi:arylsulfatase A-like enzyme